MAVCEGLTNSCEKKRSKKQRRKRNAKWLSEAALQIAVKRREAKSRGGKERYTHLNAEFQSRARRDTKRLLKKTMQRNGGK